LAGNPRDPLAGKPRDPFTGSLDGIARGTPNDPGGMAISA